jgi:dTMP kinase
MKVLREGIEGARFEIKKIDAKNTADKKKTDADETKRQADVAAERRKKAVEEAKRRAEEEAKAILEAAKAAQAARDEFLNTLEGIENSYYDRGKSKRELELQAVKDHFFQLLETARQYGEDTTILEEEQRLRLQEINAKFDEEEAAKLKEKQEKEKDEKDKKDKLDLEDAIDKKKNKTAALLELEQALYDSTAAIGQIFINDSKKLEQFQKAQTLIQIGIDTAKAISGLTASSNQNPANGVTAGLAGAVQFATGLARILTNVAKAKQLLKSPSASVSGGGGGGAAASSSSTSTQAMQPSFSLFGQANQGNNASSSQSVEQSNSMTIFAKVSAVDMTAEQASNQKNMQMATL